MNLIGSEMIMEKTKLNNWKVVSQEEGNEEKQFPESSRQKEAFSQTLATYAVGTLHAPFDFFGYL